MKIKRITCLILAIMTLAVCCIGCGNKEAEKSSASEPAIAAPVALKATYTDLFYVTDGVVAFKTAENRIGLIDSTLTEIVAAEYTEVKYCEVSDACILTKADGTTTAFNLESKQFTDDVCAHGGMSVVGWDSAAKAPLYGEDNSPLPKEEYPEEGQSIFVYDTSVNKYGLMGSDGALIIEPIYDEVGAFSGGYAAVKKNGLWGYITMGGEEVIGFYYSDAYKSVNCMNYDAGTAYKMNDGEVALNRDGYLAGIYSASNEILCKFTYRNIIPFGDGNYAALYTDGQWVYGSAASLNSK